MRSVATHRAELMALVTRLPPEIVPLRAALGRILTSPVVALADGPPFDNASMDGYAIATARGGVGQWPVSQELPAGAVPEPLAQGTVARIMTGSPIPPGADAVVPVEATDGGVSVVTIREWPQSGTYVRLRGADVRQGDEVLAPFTRLQPGEIAAAAAAGAAAVEVARRPRVAIIVTGDELASPGEALLPGQIYDSNTEALAALVTAWGGFVVSAERVPDDPRALLARIDALGALDADLIVTAGGVSAGAYDVVKEALAARGVSFGAVAMQPGKPQGWGRVAGVPIVCAPGNPVSVVVTFIAFVAPMLCAMQGIDAPAPTPATVAIGWHSPPGRAQFMPVRIGAEGVEPATQGGSGSHLVASLARADALAFVLADVTEVRPGDTVELMRLQP